MLHPTRRRRRPAVVACPAVTPLGIESLPSELAKLLRALPQLADRLDEVAESTSQMAAMREGIDRLGEDTGPLPAVAGDVGRLAAAREELPAIERSVQEVGKDTGVLREVQSSIDAMD